MERAFNIAKNNGEHKIYVCFTDDDKTKAESIGYEVKPMTESMLVKAWTGSNWLRFINSMDLTESIVPQGATVKEAREAIENLYKRLD